MSSASFQPLYNFRPIEQRLCVRGPRQPETPWSYLIVPSWNTEEKPRPAAIILQNLQRHFFFFFFGPAHTHTHTTHPEASVARVDAPHCALPDSRHRKCSRRVTSPQRQRSHEETTTKQSTYYRKCILCKNASGNVAASVRDLQSLFSLCYKLKKNNFKG